MEHTTTTAIVFLVAALLFRVVRTVYRARRNEELEAQLRREDDAAWEAAGRALANQQSTAALPSTVNEDEWFDQNASR
jgi:hypothetical protein